MLDKFCGSYEIHISISFHLSEQFLVVKKVETTLINGSAINDPKYGFIVLCCQTTTIPVKYHRII